MKITESVRVLKPLQVSCKEYINLSCKVTNNYLIEVQIYENDMEISSWEDGEIIDFINIRIKKRRKKCSKPKSNLQKNQRK